MKPEFEIQDGVLLKYHGTDRNVIVPDSVTGIRGCAFLKNIAYTDFILPNGIECLTIPASVTFAEMDALHGCSELKTLIVNQERFEIENFLNIRQKSGLESEVSQSASDTVSDTADGILNLLVNQSFRFENLSYLPEYRNAEYELAFRLLRYPVKNQKFLNLIRERLPHLFFYLMLKSPLPDKEEQIRVMLNHGIFTEDTIRQYVQYAIDLKAYEIQLMLMNYQYQHFEFKFHKEKWKL